MRMVAVIVLVMLLGYFLSGCTTQELTMKTCRRMCQHGVKAYADDTVDCVCKGDG